MKVCRKCLKEKPVEAFFDDDWCEQCAVKQCAKEMEEVLSQSPNYLKLADGRWLRKPFDESVI